MNFVHYSEVEAHSVVKVIGHAELNIRLILLWTIEQTDEHFSREVSFAGTNGNDVHEL